MTEVTKQKRGKANAKMWLFNPVRCFKKPDKCFIRNEQLNIYSLSPRSNVGTVHMFTAEGSGPC